jgi:hypothetical protein
MLWLDLKALLVCDHELGHVRIAARQSLVRIAGSPVLVDDDPEKKDIKGCPNLNPTAGIRPCLHTQAVQHGYSTYIRINGRRVCMDTVTGMTDGVPPNFHYKVRNPGQNFVSSKQQ